MSELRSAVKNAADPEQVAEARLAEEFTVSSELADAREVMSTPAGRRFVGKYLRRTGVFEDTFHPDQASHSRLAGIRWVGLQLLEDVKRADPTVLLDTIRDFMESEEKDGRRHKTNKRTRRKRTRRGAASGNPGRGPERNASGGSPGDPERYAPDARSEGVWRDGK